MLTETCPRVDFNADLGEGGAGDTALLTLISSANIACGWHAGNARSMRDTVQAALHHGLAIGAHPSFPDREHFGRREMQISVADLYADLVYQIGALDALVRSAGGHLNHVKPHGALYNMAARDPALADVIAEAVCDINPCLALYGLSGSELLRAAGRAGLRAVSEVFVDRAYRADGSLVPRGQPGAMLDNVNDIVERTVRMLRKGIVEATTGELVPVDAQTLCLHGDAPNALTIACAISHALGLGSEAARKARALQAAGPSMQPCTRISS